MIPIPGLESVVCSWITIKAEGYQLHGFLIYTASDHYFPEYINGEGLADLDVWTGHDCAIFVVHSPSEQWIEYTKASDHTWWRLFGQCFENQTQAEIIQQHGDIPILQVGNVRKTLREVFAPCLNSYLYGQEIARILSYFDLKATQHPSMILFKELDDKWVWYVDMNDLTNIPQADLRAALQRWFGGNDFTRLLKEARNA
jgi:hypothetical protein